MLPHFHLLTLGSPALLSAAGEQIRFRTRKHFAVLIRLALADGVVHTDVDALDTEAVEVRGRFLDGFDIPGSAEFEQWKDEWHARLLPRIRDALVRKMDAGRRIGEFASVERHAQALLDLDPLSEDGVRGVMEARAWVGDRTNALKAFTRYEAALEAELGAKPSSDIVRMADLMRQGRRSPLRPPTTPEPPDARAERRMEPETIIGRSREFSILYDAWLDVRRRIPRVMVVTGDPGIGKTTLTNAFLSSCQMEGAVVARAQAYDAERELPYGVLSELVRQLTSQRAIGSADPEDLAELSRVCADVNVAFPGVPKPPAWAADLIPLRLADAFFKTVMAAADDNPLVVMIDDLHAADNSSLAIVHLLARKLVGARVMLVVAARSIEMGVSEIATSLIADPTIRGLQRIELDSLSFDESINLIEQFVNATTSEPEFVPMHRIASACNGNPLAIELLSNEWLTHGQESLLTVLEAVNTRPASSLGLPYAIVAVFQRQLKRLPPDVRSTLDLAAVVGRDFVALDLYQAVQLSEPAAAHALSRLRDDGFLKDRNGSLEFRNELIRAQAYYAIAAPARQRLHRSVADILARRILSDSESSHLLAAWHYLRSDRPHSGVSFAIEGAEIALRLGAPSEAEQVLVVVQQFRNGSSDADRVDLLLARSLLHQSKATAAEPILKNLSSRRHLGVSRLADVAAMKAEALYLIDDGSGSQYARAAEEALGAAGRTGDPTRLARALFEYARSGTVCGDPSRVLDTARETQRLLAEPTGAVIPMMHYARAYCHYFMSEIEPALVCLERVIQLLTVTEDRPMLALASNGYGVLLRARCRFVDSHRAFMDALAIATKMGDDHRSSIVANNLCILYTNHGDYARGIKYGETSLAFAKRALRRSDFFPTYDSLADAYLLDGQIDRARECHLAGEGLEGKARRWGEQMLYDLEYANFALVTGNIPMALEFGDRIVRNGRGRELIVPDAGVYYKNVVFWAAHTKGEQVAWSILNGALDAFRDRHLLNYLVLLGVKAWLERRTEGTITDMTLEELRLFDLVEMPGKRELLRAQGFLT